MKMKINKEKESSTSCTVSARIICCGHRHFVSQKSGLQFPAFLIQFIDSQEQNTVGSNRRFIRYHWRSKRDFLILKRESVLDPKKSFPKSAYNNLCNQAVEKPWIRPLISDLEAERNHILSKLDIHNFDPEASGYQPRMKKSVIRLDEFLANNIGSEAWSIFCRKEESAGIINPTTFDQDNIKDSSNVHTGNAAKLSQYFTSEINAQMVVDKALHFCQIKDKDLKNKKPTDNSMKNWSPFVFVEPSCGDGRILQQLIESIPLDTSQLHCILAYDIDNHLIARCKEKYKSSAEISVSIECTNFLELTHAKLQEDIHKIRHTTENFHVVFVGNPPYSSGAGSGSGINRNLPSQFILHSITSLGAIYVSLIVPKRCNKKGDVEETLKLLEKETKVAWTCDSHELENCLFTFQDDVVKQPSVLQCWSKSQTPTLEKKFYKCDYSTVK